jgi:single-stranded-DNA-specific exonuclease
MPDIEPRHHWIVPAAHPVDEATIADARARGLSARAVRVLSRRVLLDGRELAARFDPPETCLHDAALLPDAGALLARVSRARAAGERVMVFGDFDADGLTGLAILTLALRRIGIDVLPHVPSRTEDGHGLSMRAVAEARDAGCSLIVTADTGSTSIPEVAAARELGLEVVITDHHVVGDVRPPAVALVNPHRSDSDYPDRGLSGAGVAFKVAQLLLADEPGGPEAALELADLAAIGSVADVVPMVGENRAILRLGLRRLVDAPRPGIAALLAVARAEGRRMDAETIGFVIAPRLNAMGRVADPGVAAALLLAPDAATAEGLVAELEAANDLRRALTDSALVEARAAAEAEGTGALTIVAGDWPVGVIGIVAGRLADELGRPAIVVSRALEPWRVSARSAGGFDLAAAFGQCSELLERHGGHPAAAGCHLAAEAYPDFRAKLLELAGATPPRAGRPSLRLDLVQSASAVDYVLFRELTLLEECGDAPPIVGIAGLTVARVRPANGGHTQLTLRKGADVIDAICFGRADLAGMLAEGVSVDVAARLSSRRFSGLETLQLEIRDVAPAGHLAALRAASRASPEATDAAAALAVVP